MSPTANALALLLLFSLGCDDAGSAGPPSASRPPEPPVAVLAVPRFSEIPRSATTTPPLPEPSAPDCPPPVRVAPKTLAVSWSAYLGRRVSFACYPVRRIDFVRTLVVADGARFVVMGPPEITPCSPGASTFTVLGSSAVALAGRTTLPELLLEEDEGGTR